MLGLTVMSPWPSRGSSSEETVGCACAACGRARAGRSRSSCPAASPAAGRGRSAAPAAAAASRRWRLRRSACRSGTWAGRGRRGASPGRSSRRSARTRPRCRWRSCRCPSTSTRLPTQHLGLAVVVGVHLLAGELLGAREGRLGPARVPVVAVGDQHGAVAAGLAARRRRPRPSPPTRRRPARPRDLGAEADPLAQAEVVHVVVEVVRRSGCGSGSPGSRPASGRPYSISCARC